MKPTHRTFWIVLVLSLALAGTLAAAAGEPQMSPDMQAKMEAWAKAGTPGEPHQKLAPMAGRWDAKIVYWMEPGAPPGESTGRAENKMVFGGRYLQCDFSGDMQGEKFEGLNFIGYDNVSRRYQSFWLDSMSTQMMMYTGTASEDGKVLTFEGTFVDPMTGKSMQSKTVTRIVAPEKHVLEMYDMGKDGKFFKTLEITYTVAAK